VDVRTKILLIIVIETNNNCEYTYFAEINTSFGYSRAWEKQLSR